MQTLAEIADPLHQLPLDERVHVLVRTVDEPGVGPRAIENVFQYRRNFLDIVAAEHAGFAECLDPRKASRDIVFEEPLVEPERRSELKRGGIGLGAESS